MRCPGSGGWHVGAAPLRDRDRLPRGYCPECGRSHALTHQGRIWTHRAPGPTITGRTTP
ncbi:hypothetical protein SEA_BARB_84 [Gordonia phage Barb]|uniref:Uncharacterized protein n=4 Tax=Wizardvirus TaxID=2169658 RepID=A0A5P8DC00_9CAUD|nr:hypothetical protein KNU55_gp84 [Gordonia phage Barb]YP_010103687.1 hypothetical protein KNU68_gp83 [Gordonia phage Nubi]YP_010104298.1 hypothetical protein KNU74_gp84 [Gordonia phage Fireball]WNO27963.1 hypothetical protein SEA_HALO3_79 [Gordonia phage Halo3]QDB74774.1 hypothetical protein SEA_BARB_84 [Gordonia phage Barb]QDH85216.1 hypothetical protein SEA_NUBI_83 [Gordonia phage Nubi]QFP95909.1 hypothetical protein SEA_FIREBALL_84 [Gordonia phage Fireball]